VVGVKVLPEDLGAAGEAYRNTGHVEILRIPNGLPRPGSPWWLGEVEFREAQQSVGVLVTRGYLACPAQEEGCRKRRDWGRLLVASSTRQEAAPREWRGCLVQRRGSGLVQEGDQEGLGARFQVHALEAEKDRGPVVESSTQGVPGS